MKARELLSAVPLTGVIADEIAQIHIPKGEYQQHEIQLSIYAPPIGVEDAFVSIDEISVVFHHVIQQRYAQALHPRQLKLTAVKRLLRLKVATPSVRQLYLDFDVNPFVVVPLKHLASSLRRWWVDDWVRDFLIHVSDAVQEIECIPRKNEFFAMSIKGINQLKLSCVYEQDMILAIGLFILSKYPAYTGMTYEHPDFLLWCEQITDALLAIEAHTALPIYDGFPIKQADYSSIYAHPNVIMHWLGSQLGETHPWVIFQLQKAGFDHFQMWLEALMNPENYDIPDTDGLPYQGLGGDIVNYYFLEERAHPPQILMIGWNAEVVRQYWKASLCAIQTLPHKFACNKKCKDTSGLFRLTFEEPFTAFDQRKTLLAKCDQLIICSPPDSLTQNLMDFAVQQGINVMLVNKTRCTVTHRTIYDHQCVTKGDGDVLELIQLPHSLAIVSMSEVERVCFSASRDPVVYAHGNALSLEQLDISFTTLKDLCHWLNLFDTQEDELWDCKFGYYPVVQAMILLRAYCPEYVELLWWSTDTWITLETLLANKMDNPWMQFPGSNKVNLVSLEKCYFPSGNDSHSFWPERDSYAEGIFANLDDLMIDAVFGKDFSGECMSFDQYDCECSNDCAFIDHNLAMFERVLNAVHTKTDEELLRAVGRFPESYFIPTEPKLLRESLVDYLQFVIQKINDTKAKGWYLGFVGY